uniref:cysteine dioxygenase n=1 Tax=Oryza sativa subsp. japonica TaxID=39947 RepID=Q6ZDA4_ORYSJ|nr:HGWP repeat containing protein-like [Oryza sativa Japonica Group]
MDSRRLSFPVDRPRVHSAGLSSPPPLLIATTTSPPACLRRRRLVSSPIRLVGHTTVHGRPCLHRPAGLRRRRLVFPPARLAYYAVAVGRLRLHHRPASVAADWCPRLYGRLVTPPLMGIVIYIAGLPPSPPTGVPAYTLAYYAAAVGRLRLHRRPASVAAEWCLRLHGWPIMPPLLGVYDFTAGLPPSPPSGASAYTAGLLCRRCWASTTSPPACLRRRRVVPPPTRLAYYAAAVGRLRLHRRPASVVADWCLRLHGWPIMPPLLGVYDFTAGLPPSPPSGASAYTAGLLCRRCWMSTSSPLAHLRCRRLVFPLTRLTYYAAISGHLRFHRRPPSSPPTGVFIVIDGRLCSHIGHFCHHQGEYYKAKIQIQICIKGIHGFRLISYAPGMDQSEHHRLACLRRCRLVFPPARLAFMPPLLGVYVFTDRLAFAAADWCFRLHGWPLCRRCWASTSSPTGRLVRRRLVLPPARLAFMPPLLGVYVFTDRLAFAAADWCFRLHGWPLCRRCWASTSSPTGRLVRRRLVLPPARLAYYAAVVGRLRLHRPAASSAADWCFRLHGWPIMPPLLGVYVFTDRLAFAAADWCFRLHGWPLCRRCWASTSSPTGLPSPPPTGVSACTAGLYAAVVGRLRLHRPAASSAADWCFRLHGWPIMPPLLGVYVVTDRPPRPPPTATTTDGHHHLPSPTDYAAADWCFYLHNYASSLPVCFCCRRLVFTSLRQYKFVIMVERSAPANSIAATSQVLLLHQPRRLCEPRHLGMQCHDILLQQTFYFNNFKYFGLDELGNNINSPPIICLHGWPTTQLPIEDLIVIIGCYIAIDWITDIVIFINILSSLINIANSAAVDGKLRHHSRLSLLPLIIITVGCVCRRRLFSSSS